MNWANRLTLLRVLMIPLFVVCVNLNWQIVSLVVFIGASVTDFADGYIARHYDQVTNFGKFADPLADKLLVMAALLLFVERGSLPTWVLLLVIAREFCVTGLRLVAVEGGRVIAASWSGKVKTFSTMICVCLMLLPIPGVLNTVCVGVILLTTLYSGIEYFIVNRKVFKGESNLT
jgi:CDP-diacylglycerol--glycerol-3-phosphate 3-phosphatidyltransferase